MRGTKGGHFFIARETLPALRARVQRATRGIRARHATALPGTGPPHSAPSAPLATDPPHSPPTHSIAPVIRNCARRCGAIAANWRSRCKLAQSRVRRGSRARAHRAMGGVGRQARTSHTAATGRRPAPYPSRDCASYPQLRHQTWRSHCKLAQSAAQRGRYYGRGAGATGAERALRARSGRYGRSAGATGAERAGAGRGGSGSGRDGAPAPAAEAPDRRAQASRPSTFEVSASTFAAFFGWSFSVLPIVGISSLSLGSHSSQ